MLTSKPTKLFHCTHLLCYHYVFLTQGRRECLTEEMIDRLREIIAGMVADYGGLLDWKGTPDCIQFRVRLTPASTPSVIANSVKTITSRLLRRDFPGHFDWDGSSKPAVWSREYFVTTSDRAPQAVIDEYIAGQEKAAYVSE